jgi:hypothetical protein
LAQRVLECEGLDPHAGIQDASCGRIGIGVAIAEHFRASEMRYETNIGDRGALAATEAAGARIAR